MAKYICHKLFTKLDFVPKLNAMVKPSCTAEEKEMSSLQLSVSRVNIHFV